MSPEPKPGRINAVYREYPPTFWIYNVVVFIDRFGGFMLYPFFALYLTQKFGVGMSTVGIVFAVFAVFGFVGNGLGGALADRLGRRTVILFSLVFSALSALGMGLAPNMGSFVALTAVVGVLANIGGPAHEAIVADLLPPEKRAEGYGIVRVVFNLAVVIAPAVAGLLIARGYLLLFIVDAAISLTAAAVALLWLPETRPERHPDTAEETMSDTFRGYLVVLRDRKFVAFGLVGIVLTLVYMNFNTTLGVFLRDIHGVPEVGYGYLLSLNAFMVVVLQIWVARRLSRFKPMLVMAAGSLLYAIGFGAYGWVSTYTLFMAAMVIITVGEMVISPIQQTLVADFAPEDMRGRYMAVAGLSWGIGYAIGPYGAGWMMDNLDPSMLWNACFILGMVAMVGYVMLDRVHGSPRLEDVAASGVGTA